MHYGDRGLKDEDLAWKPVDEKCMGRYAKRPPPGGGANGQGGGGGGGFGGPGPRGGEPNGGGGTNGGNNPSEEWECDMYLRCGGQGGEGDGVPCNPECPPIGVDCWAEWRCVRIK